MVAVFDAGHLVVGGWLQEPAAAPGTQRFWGSVGRVGPCRLPGSVAPSRRCLVFSVSNSLFSLLPRPTAELYLVNTVICIYCK